MKSHETDSSYSQPRPRPPRSPAQSAKIRVRNRRREHLERHPSYFDSLEHELADPLLYDSLIRRFQSPADREKEGRKKGYSRVLEVDLLRGEAKLTKARSSSNRANGDGGHSASSSSAATKNLQNGDDDDDDDDDDDVMVVGVEEHVGGTVETPAPGDIGGCLAPPQTLDEGRERWRDFLRRRFVLGRDDDFDYRTVDENDDLDALERRDQVEAWFDDEEPGWASDQPGEDDTIDSTMGATRTRPLEGETGIQDF